MSRHYFQNYHFKITISKLMHKMNHIFGRIYIENHSLQTNLYSYQLEELPLKVKGDLKKLKKLYGETLIVSLVD